MFIRTVISATMVLALVRCTPEEERESPLKEPCMASCGKFLCAADVEVDCEQYCDNIADRAAELGEQCSRDLQVLFECQEDLDCTEHAGWYHQEPGAKCLAEESDVMSNCPGVQLR